MDPFIFIFIGELIIILFLVIIRYLFKRLESKKVDKILYTFKDLSSNNSCTQVHNIINNIDKKGIDINGK